MFLLVFIIISEKELHLLQLTYGDLERELAESRVFGEANLNLLGLWLALPKEFLLSLILSGLRWASRGPRQDVTDIVNFESTMKQKIFLIFFFLASTAFVAARSLLGGEKLVMQVSK